MHASQRYIRPMKLVTRNLQPSVNELPPKVELDCDGSKLYSHVSDCGLQTIQSLYHVTLQE